MNWKNALCLLKAIRTSATRGKCFFPSFRNSERVTWNEFLLQTLLAAVARPKTARWATRSVLAGAVAPGHWRDPTARRRNAWRDGVMAWWRGPSKVCRLSIVGFVVTSSDIKWHQGTSYIPNHLRSSAKSCFASFLYFSSNGYNLIWLEFGLLAVQKLTRCDEADWKVSKLSMQLCWRISMSLAQSLIGTKIRGSVFQSFLVSKGCVLVLRNFQLTLFPSDVQTGLGNSMLCHMDSLRENRQDDHSELVLG